MIVFSDNPLVPLNKKISELRESVARSSEADFIRLCREIYSLGFADGEAYSARVKFVDDVDHEVSVPRVTKWYGLGNGRVVSVIRRG